MEKLQTNEMFALPIGLKAVVKLDSEILYGGESLNRSFIKALSKSSRTNKISSQFEKMIKDKHIVPCFLHKRFLMFLAWRVFAPSGVRNIMGFYYPKSKKVYILLSNDLNIFGYTSNNFLAKLTIHECMHMFADKKPSSFLNIFKNEIDLFYKKLLCKIFSIDERKLDNSIVNKISRFIFTNFERKEKITNSDLSSYFKLLNSELRELSTLSEDVFEKILTEYVVISKIYLHNIGKFFAVKSKFKHILGAIESTYKEAFNFKNIDTICIQELLYPSEIIAIYSEYEKNPKIFSSIKQL